MPPVTPDSALGMVQKKTRAAVLARPESQGLPQPVCPERAEAETHVISIYAPMSHVYDQIGQRDDCWQQDILIP